MIEYCKNATLTFLARIHKVQVGTNFLKKFSAAHKVKNAEHVFKSKGAVYAPNFDGVNPFGGIAVKREEFSSDEEYENKREEIMDALKQVTHNGKPIMKYPFSVFQMAANLRTLASQRGVERTSSMASSGVSATRQMSAWRGPMKCSSMPRCSCCSKGS